MSIVDIINSALSRENELNAEKLAKHKEYRTLCNKTLLNLKDLKKYGFRLGFWVGAVFYHDIEENDFLDNDLYTATSSTPIFRYNTIVADKGNSVIEASSIRNEKFLQRSRDIKGSYSIQIRATNSDRQWIEFTPNSYTCVISPSHFDSQISSILLRYHKNLLVE